MKYTLNDFLFMSSGCVSDYFNRFIGAPYESPTVGSTIEETQFIDFMNNYKYIDFDDRILVKYENVNVIKKGLTFNTYNRMHNICSEKTFAFQYLNTNDNKRLEFYYRHYEYNQKNVDKIDRRIERFHKSSKIPFFISGFSPEMIKKTSLGYRLFVTKLFLKSKYPYKIIISGDKRIFNNIDKKYFILTDKMHEELNPLILKHLDEHWNIS